MAERKRQIAVITSIVMLSVMLFATFYIISETNHECDGGPCPICAHIDQFEVMLSGSANDAAAGAAIIAVFTTFLLLSDCQVFCLATPVTKKVRMDH